MGSLAQQRYASETGVSASLVLIYEQVNRSYVNLNIKSLRIKYILGPLVIDKDQQATTVS